MSSAQPTTSYDLTHLIGVRASHYVERARWALEVTGVPFHTTYWPPYLHQIGVQLFGTLKNTVPLLVTPHGGILQDSGDIVRYASRVSGQLYPQDPLLCDQVHDWERMFAARLGVWTRLILYWNLFQQDPGMAAAFMSQGSSQWKHELFVSKLTQIKSSMMQGMRVSADNADICSAKVRQLFAEVGAALQRGAGRYLVGDRFTAADLTFASMAAPVLMPEQYGADWPATDIYPAGVLQSFRDTPAGRYALDVYGCHRHSITAGSREVAHASKL